MQALTVNAKVWGAVAEVTAKELIISLPHGLRGHVSAAEVLEAALLLENMLTWLHSTILNQGRHN